MTYAMYIEPNENESYQDYINRLKTIRNLGKKNRPENIYTEGHHILPKCMGGKDNKDNIIILFPEEHYYCHKLLAIENPDVKSLQFAWWLMCHKTDGDTKRYYKVSVKDYAEAQSRAALLSQQMNGKPVVELISGTIYPSAEEAARLLKIIQASNITTCCKGRAKSANGYQFCYLEDYLMGNYEIKTRGNNKRIIDIDTGEVYESAKEASEKLGVNATKIRDVCRGVRITTGGHRFAYQEDYLSGNYNPKLESRPYRPIQEVESGKIYNNAADAGRDLNVDSSGILKVCKGKLNAVKGHKFIFYLENVTEMDNQQPSS